MRKLLLLFLFIGCNLNAQNLVSKEFTYNEFIGYVKKYHPLVKIANLEINKAQANLMIARGGFDPNIEVDFSKKQFKNNEYYSILNSSFKIPTWYGIEVKAGFDNSEGIYLNPDNTLPNQGLTSLGISIPLGQGLFINERMANLRKAKIQLQLSQAERKLQAIEILYDASIAYFNWKKTYSEYKLYEEYTKIAQIRFDGIQSLIKQGDKAPIDSIEAGIIVKNRLLSAENSRLKLAKSKLELANYLWLENNIPLELADDLIPEINLELSIQETLKTNDLINNQLSLNSHPKINALQNKIDILNVERKLKANMLLPKIDLGYSYLSEPSYFENYQFKDYKIGMNFYFPLFLRKERGNLKIAKFKVQETEFLLEFEQLQLQNKINAQKIEINSYLKQIEFAKSISEDNKKMLESEEKLFLFGESSLFLINSRENNLVTAKLSQIALENSYFVSNSELFKIMANPE